MKLWETDDSGLENLLALDGDIYVIHEDGYWVKFEVRRVERSGERPHGVEYCLTLHDPGNVRIAGFDNAHAVRMAKGPGGRAACPFDHRHRYSTVKRYVYRDAASLLVDFWATVEDVLREEGVSL